MGLTDWTLDRANCAEVEKMNVYQVPEFLDNEYRGAGYALAAVKDEKVVALRYIVDHVFDIDGNLERDLDSASKAIKSWTNSQSAETLVRELSDLGGVSIGICSCWEFVEF